MKLSDKDILYQDNHLIAVYKPAGEVTQGPFQESVRAWIKMEGCKPGNVFLEPVHRLDKPVQGIVLFAKTSKALTRMNEQMRDRLIERWYIAGVEGKMQGGCELVHKLRKEPHRSVVAHDGKESRLIYKVVSGGWLEIQLITGRYHQIRCQLAAIGHPIIGDAKYGASSNGIIQLQHQKMRFKHPTRDEWVEIKCRNKLQSR